MINSYNYPYRGLGTSTRNDAKVEFLYFRKFGGFVLSFKRYARQIGVKSGHLNRLQSKLFFIE